MQYEYTLAIHDNETPFSRETFKADPEKITTESAEHGERVVVYDDGPEDILLEAFVPKGTVYTLRRED
ncbi:hypothetical protein HYG81_15180 [Natrinema zhouii]|uniref:Uncharacterized protein n=1 Tax=Natrinema zhouii TaxID=1710539 RepID=A0A7D6CNU2_9EURY|nr:hypothetical protein [Natrinema zhouii]QLK25416.1 hypothetical protein HYG81_15180 [Natrinema zhouii]